MRKDRAMHNIVILGKADLHSETKRVSPAWAPVQQTGKSRPIHLHRFLAEEKNRLYNRRYIFNRDRPLSPLHRHVLK